MLIREVQGTRLPVFSLFHDLFLKLSFPPSFEHSSSLSSIKHDEHQYWNLGSIRITYGPMIIRALTRAANVKVYYFHVLPGYRLRVKAIALRWKLYCIPNFWENCYSIIIQQFSANNVWNSDLFLYSLISRYCEEYGDLHKGCHMCSCRIIVGCSPWSATSSSVAHKSRLFNLFQYLWRRLRVLSLLSDNGARSTQPKSPCWCDHHSS